ncbi:MAG: cytochrome c biogenesis protein CcsA [Xanthomonadales bacterium]|nr:cytochrome c biogenesis protein CcsA [Xanthomonadales bacterium]
MTWLFALAAITYALASTLMLRRRDDANTGAARAALMTGMVAMLAHAVGHVIEIQRAGGIPLGFFAALSWVSLGMAALSTLVAWTRTFAALGVMVFPLAALVSLGYALLPRAQAAPDLSWPLQLHAGFALLAYATLAVAAVMAVLLALQDRLLRQRQLDHALLRRLPPLTELESLMFRCVAAGFALLTLALALGVVFVEDLFAQHLVHKTVLSVLSWMVFGALLFGRWRYGWRGRRAIRLTLAAMALLLLAFFGSRFVLELLLHRTPY